MIDDGPNQPLVAHEGVVNEKEILSKRGGRGSITC
jgi:hypothetical protein